MLRVQKAIIIGTSLPPQTQIGNQNSPIRLHACGAGRQPGPWERIKRQLANEASVLERAHVGTSRASPPTLISWEWLSCLSPLLPQADPRAAAAKSNYEAYRTYVGR